MIAYQDATEPLAHERLAAPFPWYGGKSRAADLIWQRLGPVVNYVEPFFGSGAVLLNRPHAPGIETVNDKDCFLANFFRALQAAPDEVAWWCDKPVNEADMTASHCWLVNQRETFAARMFGEPDFYDAKVAGRWCWGLCCWIGSGWCSGDGPWQSVKDEEGSRQLVHLGNAGRGVHRQLVHLGNAGRGVHRQLVHLGNAGRGVHRKRVHLGGVGAGVGVHKASLHGTGGLIPWFRALAERLYRVRVCCGDWMRVLGPSVTETHGLTGVVLDPPYDTDERADVYVMDSKGITEAVRQWALDNGENPLLRIVLCGYETETYTMPAIWEKVAWKTNGGYGNQGQGRGRTNSSREVLWFSPACLSAQQPDLFTTNGAHP